MRHFDVSAAAQAYRGEDHKKFRGLVRSWLSALSIDADLTMADRCLQKCLEIDQGTTPETELQDPDSGLLGQALFSNAVLLYVRSTHGEGGRSVISPQAAYNDTQKATHRQIVRLRNEVIAHFGLGSHLRQGFNHELAVLSVRPNGSGRLRIAYKRTNYLSQFLTGLQDLLATAKPWYIAYAEGKAEAIYQMVEQIPELATIVFQSPFNPYEYFHPKAAAQFDDLEYTGRGGVVVRTPGGTHF